LPPRIKGGVMRPPEPNRRSLNMRNLLFGSAVSPYV
jgi:hypothetical protein